MKKKFSINSVETRRVGMLALFGAFLEGCGGGGAGGSNLISVGGNAVKGPLQGADVFADYNDNGVQDAGEPGTTTDENGAYNLQVTQSSTIVVKTNANTVDTSTGNLIGEGTVLKAPAGATVVSPSTTLLHAGVDEAVLKASLGIPQNVDLATYNPFDTSAAGYNANDALAYEKASVTVYTTVKALAAAAVAAGGDADAAQASALASVVDLVQKTPTGTATSVFEDTALLRQAVASVESSLSVDLSAVSADLVTATATVYEAVRDNMTDIQSDNTSAIISVATETFIQQVSSGTITLTDANSVSTAVAAVNLAPTDITFNSQGVVFYEGISAGTVIGSFAAVDPNSGDTHEFTLSGTDADSFSLSEAGVLTFTGVADYEAQSSYSITVTATDDGEGLKARTETFTLTVTDVAETIVLGSNTATFMEDPDSGVADQYITQSISFDEVSNGSGVDLIATETVIMDRTNLSDGFDANGFLGYDSNLQLSLSEVDDGLGSGSGSGTVIFSLMDGDDSVRSQGERELIVAMDVSWTDASGSTVLTVDSTQQLDGDSVTNFTGVVKNDAINGSTATNQISNTFEFAFETLSPSEIVSADGSVLTLNLAQMLAVVSTLTEDGKPLFDVTTANGGYYYSLETDLPFISGTSGEAIASISGDLDIVVVADLV